MAREPQIGLVGRDDITALVESLVERRAKHPLPVIVAFGPGGSGKTSLLDHVRHRCRDAPTAEVDLDKALPDGADLLDGIDPYLRPKRPLPAARSADRRNVRPGPACPPGNATASLPRQSTVGMFPYSRRWPRRNAVRRMVACSGLVLLVLCGVAFCLQNSAHCLRYGILEPAELVADFSGVRTRISKMDGLQCVGLSK